ncbi:Major facilitator superfamily domain-containing protein 10 [Escovopsis weberi]|uniref:Major facilitator superfamily domain-containing protein 10 n=1 Tax=Escovopsis weberi TaxID=150374 RepID=A0A0M8N150_ESCWE|nr:Major facilitator superfamily domain-containing protein 10 [Escovopsis weberi]
MPPKLHADDRNQIIRVVILSLLLDLISFTFILPLFPKLLEYYRDREAPSLLLKDAPQTLLQQVLGALNAYKSSFSRPIDSRYDIVLLGGALGSLFSLLQAISSPIIGRLSDKYGRRKALLTSMAGNILSVLLWVAAVDFRTFVASRIVGGLFEGNVQLATAIATDLSDDASRGPTMALIGACFSVAFTFGPALGAFLASITSLSANPFAMAAGFSLALVVVETVYLYRHLPETLPSLIDESQFQNKYRYQYPYRKDDEDEQAAQQQAQQQQQQQQQQLAREEPAARAERANSHVLLNATHFFFLLFFSGMESSMTFLSYDLFGFTSGRNGRLLGFIGLVASVFQGMFTRRMPPLVSVRCGVAACLAAFVLLGRIASVAGLYLAAFFLAVTSATVVTGLNALSSFEAAEDERGSKLGNLRSWGQLGRGLGPILFTSVYWWAGREVAYSLGAVGIAGVLAVTLLGLKKPNSLEKEKEKGE